ncbi:MAG: PLDc N-terminal domain-containing protein [Candidatus Omnitrophica bacterium]|nr:PLDc N-terminal domain-containing protein [Candidatus Omnitrophota bacterium]
MEEFFSKGIPSVIVMVIAVFLFLFWIRMLIDCLNRDFIKRRERIIWFLTVIFFQAMGAFIYWLRVYRKA